MGVDVSGGLDQRIVYLAGPRYCMDQGAVVENQRSKRGQARMVCELKQIEFVGEVWARNMSIIVNCLIGLIETG